MLSIRVEKSHLEKSFNSAIQRWLRFSTKNTYRTYQHITYQWWKRFIISVSHRKRAIYKVLCYTIGISYCKRCCLDFFHYLKALFTLFYRVEGRTWCVIIATITIFLAEVQVRNVHFFHKTVAECAKYTCGVLLDSFYLFFHLFYYYYFFFILVEISECFKNAV